MAEERNKLVRCVEWILAIFVLTLAFYAGDRFERWRIGPMESSVDTVYRTVTVYKDFPYPVKTVSAGFVALPAYRFLTDTVNRDVNHFVPVYLKDSSDTVLIQREQKYYSEDGGRLRLWVSGVDPRLDRWELDRIETTITETYKPPSKRWGLGLYAEIGSTFAKEQSTIGTEAGLLLRYQSPDRWGIDLLGGYSAMFMKGQFVPSPHARVKVSYDLITW